MTDSTKLASNRGLARVLSGLNQGLVGQEMKNLLASRIGNIVGYLERHLPAARRVRRLPGSAGTAAERDAVANQPVVQAQLRCQRTVDGGLAPGMDHGRAAADGDAALCTDCCLQADR